MEPLRTGELKGVVIYQDGVRIEGMPDLIVRHDPFAAEDTDFERHWLNRTPTIKTTFTFGDIKISGVREYELHYGTPEPEPELGPDVPWILVEEVGCAECQESAAGHPAMWSDLEQSYIPVPKDGGTGVGIDPDDILSWSELEEPTFALRGAA